MQVQKCDLTLVRVVPLEMPAPQQAAVVSCSQVNLGVLPYCLGFLRICDKCVGQRSDYVVT